MVNTTLEVKSAVKSFPSLFCFPACSLSGSPEVGESVSEEGMAGECYRKTSRSQVCIILICCLDCLCFSFFIAQDK